MNEVSHNYRKLMSAVLRQAIDDYVKLQHPKQRQRKYEKEAFVTAIDLFWEEDYLLNIKNEEGENFTLKDLCTAASGRKNVDLELLKKSLIDQSIKYWKTKQMNTINIPMQFVVSGHVYSVDVQSEQTGHNSYNVDYNNKIIYVADNDSSEESFLRATLEVTCHHNKIKMSAASSNKLGEALFEMMKVNNCFVGEQW